MSGSGTLRSTHRLVSAVPWLALVGFFGSLLVALTSWWVGATPWTRHTIAAHVSVSRGTSLVPHPLMLVLYYVGLAVLVGAWLLLGHELFTRPNALAGRTLRRVAVLWAAPLLVSMPLGSRDLWAYAAQANVAAHGLDPSVVGPAAVPGNFTDQVTRQWVALPSPYGPLWTSLSHLLRLLLGAHPTFVAMGLRLFAVAGFVLLAWTLPILARGLDRHPSPALWAVVINPLFLLHGIGGGHNDLLMAALVCLAVVLAIRMTDLIPTMAAAGAIVGLAAVIKLPALIALPFLVLIWAKQRRVAVTPKLAATAIAAATAASLVVCAAVSLVAGSGLDWITQASSSAHSGGPAVTALIVLGAAACWWRGLFWEPVAMLAAATVVMLMLIPIAEWWYWFLPIAIAAPLLTRQLTAVGLAGVSIALTTIVRPDGNSAHLRTELLVAVGLFAAWLLLDRSRPRVWDRLAYTARMPP